MNRITSFSLAIALFFLSGLIKAQAQNSTLHVEISGAFTMKKDFNTDIIWRQLTAQTKIDTNATFGFFTGRSAAIPFYFSCVLVDIPSKKIGPGTFSVVEVKNDIPTSDTIKKGGFIAIKLNKRNVARQDEYISVPGTGNTIIILSVNGTVVNGSFNTFMQCTNDEKKIINVKGTFRIITKK
ncbi:hypothetical protein [Pedobacter cryoconitis]|uniref:Uncharacterized protein n=1 Tax=Pedobacter cryoconitis TaxID=188932 RepID=A0A7X0J4P7_9SPHI|nr:hypothetical protein [Pedobacter cryoconitis]MBB6501010.1 hypothetical protein [Pedobacter cryoconitis]